MKSKIISSVLPRAGALLLSCAAVSVLLAPQLGSVAEARPRPAATAPGGATAVVRITEGQVGEAAPGGTILYPSVTSCLTVTVRLGDGARAGAHASLFRVPGEYRSDEILAALKRRVGDRPVSAVEVRGATGAWYPGYFVKAIESYGDGESVPFPTRPDPEGIARAVADGLGQPRAAVTVEDLPDGDIAVG
ncbi:hypothetical protein [Streptomyces sp. ISL-11]|uniref:hypothetical protein n=1 Tax=Streptomyces sp. ISL-11 TaxID=2819174 RepID=UPI001BEA1A71|nr:hypothetical protein [Streptomyces sp. ISL-11]MBT2385499.1 hypothetical protein [Streptomyces sp. ISL-11]